MVVWSHIINAATDPDPGAPTQSMSLAGTSGGEARGRTGNNGSGDGSGDGIFYYFYLHVLYDTHSLKPDGDGFRQQGLPGQGWFAAREE